jgi:hypothetical protein
MQKRRELNRCFFLECTQPSGSTKNRHQMLSRKSATKTKVVQLMSETPRSRALENVGLERRRMPLFGTVADKRLNAKSPQICGLSGYRQRSGEHLAAGQW